MRSSFAALTFALLLPACGGSGTMPSARNELTRAASLFRPLQSQTVYWTLVGASGEFELQFANVPLHKTSKVATIRSNSKNMLVFSSGMRVDAAGRLWILTFGAYGGNPGSVYVFDLPLTKESTPRYKFVLEGMGNLNQLAFDASGHLWVTSHYGNAVLEYMGPFNHSGTLSPAVTLTIGIQNPSGLAFDESGNLYISNATGDTKHSIAVFAAPISNKQPYFLDGLKQPGGLIFNTAGDLYASENSASVSAIVRYNRDHLMAGANPSIVDRIGLNEINEKNFALSAAGDLYFSNCGKNPSVYWYATSKRPFTAKLAPAVNYINREISAIGCVWGIAIE